MAILKSLINTGVTRLLGKVYMEDLMVSGDASFSSVSVSGNITAGDAFYSGINGLYINNKKAIFTNSATDNWLRINGNINFSSGVYFGNSVVRTDGELQVGSGGAYLKSNSTNTIIAKLSSPSSTITDLSSTTGSITTLSSSTINADNVNVTNVLRSARWNIQSVAQMGGSLYVSPTLYFPNQATTLNITKNGSTLTITITDSTFNTNDLCGFVWTVNSRVKVSAKIGGVVTGTMDGVIQDINTGNGTITLQVSGENSNNVVAGSYTSSGFSDMSVMMYQRRSGSYDYRTGIWLNCYDNSNESATIRLYGGNSQYPNVMIGNLTGASLPTVENTTPTGWGLYSDNVFLTGTIFSENGRIGGWKISDKGLRKGTLGQPGSIYLIPYDATDPNYQNSDKITIAGSGRLDNWTITSSETFGVTSDGSVYMNRGRVGNWVLSPDALYNLNLGTSPRIPSDYQEVEYLSFNEGAFFQKDFSATSGQTVIARIKFQYLGSLTENFMVAGDGAVKNGVRLEFGHSGGVWYNGTYQVASDGDYPNQIMEGYQSKTLTANVTYNYGIGQRCGYSADNTQSVKVWYIRIYIAPANGAAELAYEFVPCYRKSDGVIGMYETVNGEFIYTNQGAGTITKGLDIVGVSPNLMYPGTYVGTDRIYNYKDQNTFVEIKDGVITAKNAVINGNITSVTGNIGGWTIGVDSLSNGTFGSADSIFLIPAGSTTSKQIGGSDSISNWVISVGNTFGVTKAGVLYATGANISGVINATTGTFGGSSGFTIDTGKIYSGSHSSYNTAANGVYIGTDYISLGSGGAIYFKNDGTGKIGPWNITASSIYKGTSESFYTSGVMYFGNSGLSLGNTFKVTSAGVLTAASGAIGGISMNNSYGLYTNSKTSVNSTKTGFLISKNGAIYLGAYDSNTQACPFQVTADGALTSTSGKIGSWNINATSIYKGNETMGTAGSGNMYFGDSGLSISNTFSVTSAGVLSATGATINGTLTAGADSVIGPWNVTANSIYIGNSTMGANGSNAYLGTSGISVSDGFKVTSSGKLTVKTEYRIQGTKPNDDTESVDNDFPIIRGNGYKVNDNKYWRSINIASVFLSNTPITNGGPTDTTSTLPQVGMTISQYTGQSTAETRYGYIRQSADYYDIGGITLSNGSSAYAEDMSILSKSFGVYTGSSTSSFQVLTTRVNINDSDVYINSNKFITAGSYKVNMCNLHISPGLASPNGGLSTAVTLPANSRYLFVVFHNSTSALCGIYLISTDSSSISVATIVSAANISFSNSGLSFRYKNAHTSSTANGRMIYMGS